MSIPVNTLHTSIQYIQVNTLHPPHVVLYIYNIQCLDFSIQYIILCAVYIYLYLLFDPSFLYWVQNPLYSLVCCLLVQVFY